MWRVNRLVVTDKNGNCITVDNEKVVVCTVTSNGRIYRNFELKENPPCLTVAVNDLLKLLIVEIEP